MIKLSGSIWPEQTILDELNFANGSNFVKFRYDVYMGAAKTGSVPGECTVRLDRHAAITRTARFVFYDALDWIHESVVPVMLLRISKVEYGEGLKFLTCGDWDATDFTLVQWDALGLTCAQYDVGSLTLTLAIDEFVEFPLGKFILSTPAKVFQDGRVSYQVDGYDQSLILAEDCILESLEFAPNTQYLDAIQEVIASAGISDLIINQDTSAALLTYRKFEIGTPKLDIVNTLLKEISFFNLFCDHNGSFVLRQNNLPNFVPAQISYKADNLSIIGYNGSSTIDFFKAPNVFIGVYSSPEYPTPLQSIYKNENLDSLLSIPQRGRNIVAPIIRVDSIGSQALLDTYIYNYAWEHSQVYESITFETALNPLHELGESLIIDHPEIQGNYIEDSWEFPCVAGGKMMHTARRFVYV